VTEIKQLTTSEIERVKGVAVRTQRVRCRRVSGDDQPY
jgi:hypothetical protein